MAHYTENDLEILIATMDREDLSFLEAMFNCPVDQIEASVMVVNQSKSHQLVSHFENITVINDVNKGLSRSRNLALEHSSRKLLWILDDDCKVLPDSCEKIVAAHNKNDEDIITFKTQCVEDGSEFWEYPKQSQLLNATVVRNVLSPEITLKKTAFVATGLKYNERFGLGAQFQDSENYVFLSDAIDSGLKVRFAPEFIVKHPSTTSSDEADSDRVIYARGALAARKGIWKATYYNFKYSFFLWRKGYVKSPAKLWRKHKVFERGVNDYLWGFENR
jgi:glycosyltransferase involved in cell wall biosynthesis